MAYVRRYTSTPTTEQLLEIEAINIIDLAPPLPSVGVGSGTLLLVGEFEDGPFAAGGDSEDFGGDLGVIEVTSSEDMRQKFGGFGFTYGEALYQNPCARRRKGEAWNGSGFIKAKYLKSGRLVLARVDVSTGSVAFQTRACVTGTSKGPRAMNVADILTVTGDQGSDDSDLIAAVAAVAAGSGFAATSGFLGGEAISIQIDGGPVVPISFRASDSTPAQVAARINAVMGYTIAAENTGEVDLTGLILGTAGAVVLADVTAGALAAIGHTAGSDVGTGNVANVAAVTNAELANIVNTTAVLTAVGIIARVDDDGFLVICSDTDGPAGTIQITETAGSIAAGLPTDAVASGVHDGGTIPAGTRVRAGVVEYVTTQTIAVSAGTATAKAAGPFSVKVRPATDNGTSAGSLAAAVDTVVDQPTFSGVSVTNPLAISAALSEAVIDEAYRAAFEATVDLASPAKQANWSLCARSGAIVAALGKDNAVSASNEGLFGRKFIYGAELGLTRAQAETERATLAIDRVVYTWPYWNVRVPEIAVNGIAGGDGFTADGVIEVRSDGPLATIVCTLPPEENPGQATGLIDNFFKVSSSEKMTLGSYKALKANGIAGPRVDEDDGSLYQSGITTANETERKNIARRAMADTIQDTLSKLAGPYSKKANKVSRRTGVRSRFESYLGGLLSENQPELSRIVGYSIDEKSGNTDDRLRLGIYTIITRVQTLSSLDAIVLQTEIGEGTVTTFTL